jgi:hypothetical protein
MKRTLLTTAAFIAVLLIGANAQADNTFNNASGNDWNTPANWDQGHVPTAAENAVIPLGETCNVNIATAVADTIEVYGTLNIQSDCTLTLDNTSSSGSVIDGTVNLEWTTGSPATYGTLAFTTNDHTLSYSSSAGSIIGAGSECLITLGSDNLDLTSNVTISGALAITESGTRTSTSFINDGLVSADLANGTLELAVDALDDGTCSTGDWEVCASGATLQFSVGSVKLSGDFYVSDGTLDLDANVSTEGRPRFSGGTIDATGVTFGLNQSLGC